MNPLLSLSFLSPVPASAVGGMVTAETDVAAQNNGDADQFGNLLTQSGEQHTADGQRFAGFNLNNKTKRQASMEGASSGRPEITLPPVIPPDALLISVDKNAAEQGTAEEHATNEKNAAALLGLLDLAAKAKQQLAAQAEAKAQGSAKAESKPGSEDSAATKNAVNLEISDAKKSEKGEWTTLPVYPELAAIDIADSDTLTELAKAVAKTNAESSEGLNKAASAAISDSSQPKPELKQQGTAAATLSLAEQAMANQAAGKATANDEIGSKQHAAAAEAANMADAELSADKLAKPEQALAESKVAVAASQSAKPESDKAPAASAGAQATVSGSKGVAQAELAANQVPAATEASTSAELMPKSTETESATKPATTAGAQSANTVTTSMPQPEAATTIFDKPAATIFDKQGAADTSTPASSLASAATVADSAMARQQQRAGLAEGVNQTKQALAASADTSGNNVDVGAPASGQRPESALTGFGTVFSQAGLSQSEAVAARMDGATIASAQQTAEQTKAKNVSKSVTEQLKQVNLLAQNAAGQLKERINLMVRQNIQVAEIRLDPADLGQMQIRVNLQQEQATVQFIVQQQHAKELLEQQMPRLREMMQQQGIQLGEGQVQQQRQGDGQASGKGNGRAGSGQGDELQHLDEQATAVQLEVKLSERLVDYYA